MRRLASILFVPLAKRNNPAAARRVAELSSRNDARLTVMGVVAERTGWQRLLAHPHLDDVVRRAEQEAMLKRLKSACGGDSGTNFLVASGQPPRVVIEEVLRAQHDLVVVTADDDREDHATLKRLLRACPCPVWVIRPTRASVQRVLAAVDPEPGQRHANEQILDLARSMHDLGGGEIHVVHAWELQGESTMRNSAFTHMTSRQIDSLLEQEQQRHHRALDDLLESQTGTTTWHVHLTKGRPGDVITDLVARKRINLLVMGTHGRGGVAGLLVGNTAERLLDEVTCSVIVTKPPDFTSPLSQPTEDEDFGP